MGFKSQVYLGVSMIIKTNMSWFLIKKMLGCTVAGFCLSLCVTLNANGDEGASLQFSFDNSLVNQALINVYENNSTIWQDGQAYLIGMCYVHEHRLNNALAIFEKLQKNKPFAPRNSIALGNVYHMMGDIEKASTTYEHAWVKGKHVIALKQLAVLRLQQKDMTGLDNLIDSLLVHQKENIEIQKVLLSYCLMVEDIEKGRAIAAAVIRDSNKETIEQNPDLRKLLIVVTMKYSTKENKIGPKEAGSGLD